MELEVGAWLWWVALIPVLSAAVPGARIGAALRAARRARRRRAALGTPTPTHAFVDGGPAVLEGSLEARGHPVPRHGDERPVAASSVSVDDAGEARILAHEQATGLSIVLGGLSVEIAGRLDVQCGSRERHTGLTARWVRKRLRRRLPEGSDEVQGAIVVRSLAAADRVRIAGHLRRVSAAEDVALYREAAARWRIVPSHEGGTLAVVTSRRPRIAGPALVVLGRRGVAALALFALVFLGGGEVSYRSGFLFGATFDPLRRDAALDRLFDGWVGAAREGRGTDALERAASTPSLRSRCVEAVDVIASIGEPERAARLGERCGTPETLARAGSLWSAHGHWDRAARAFVRAPPQADPAALQALILASSHARAAFAIHAGVPTATRGCLWLALQARAAGHQGHNEPLDGLRQAAASPDIQTRFMCGLLLADLTQGQRRLEVLSSLPAALPGTPWAEIAELLAWEADPGRRVPAGQEPMAVGAMPRSLAFVWGPSLHAAPGLEASVLDALGERRDPPALALRGRLATARATLEAIAGDEGAAREWLAQAVDAVRQLPATGEASLPADVDPAARNLSGLGAAIALRAGDVEGARALVAERTPWLRPTLESTIREIGLTSASPGPPPSGDRPIERLFVRQGGRLALARARHDTRATAELRAVVARHRAALLSRDSAVLLAAASLASPALFPVGAGDETASGFAAAAATATNPVVRRMLQIYALYGTPETPLFPIGWLAAGTAARFPFRIASGECRTYVAVGGPGLTDIGVVVMMPDGTSAVDATVEDIAIARACSGTTGPVVVEVRAATGSGGVALQSFAPPGSLHSRGD